MKNVNTLFSRILRPALFIFIITITACTSSRQSDIIGSKAKIFVSILPQKYFVEKIGGSAVDVHVMVRPGQSPHSYEPTPKQMSALSNTKIFFAIGISFEKVWLGRMGSENPDMKIIPTQKGIKLRKIEAHFHPGHSKTEGHEESLDPHIWLDPILVIEQGRVIADGLLQVLPEKRASIETNLQLFILEMTNLDEAIRNEFKGIKHNSFLVFHPTWGYFADRYGLEQLAIEQEGKEPSAKHLAEIIETSKKKNIRVIFVQEQFSKTYAESIANAIGAKVITFDPLAEDYSNNLLITAKRMAECLK
jgi:zinc transport system substrate-binding protein